MAIENLPDPGVGSPRSTRTERARAAVRRAGQSTRFTVVRATRWLLLHATAAALSVAFGLLVTVLAAEYGYHPVRNAVTWANQPFGYAVAGACTACHEPERSATTVGGHEALSCESCHGPQQEHVLTQQAAAATPRPAGAVLAVAIEPSVGAKTTCLLCHEAVVGRPRAFPMVSSATHFGGATCRLCHDPHETTALTPPIARHALDNLPDCLVCHGQGGIRAMTAEHPVVTGLDCLACHLRRTD